MSGIQLNYAHLQAMTTPLGLYEHALGTEPRVEEGYCVDDAARALVLVSREPSPRPETLQLSHTYLTLIKNATAFQGGMRNRMDADGNWTDTPTSKDHWGRALWALGEAVNGQDTHGLQTASETAGRALRQRSRWPRAMAYASIGASLLQDAHPKAATGMLKDGRERLARPLNGKPWPEQRLTYANPVWPQALIIIGHALEDEATLRQGLAMLTWLTEQQMRNGHLSLIAAGGRDWDEAGTGVGAQQPIEAACLAEAAYTAWQCTQDPSWLELLGLTLAWFEGDNDGQVVMHDAETGGGYDGLEAHGASINQGAESTLAWMSTRQLAGKAGIHSKEASLAGRGRT